MNIELTIFFNLELLTCNFYDCVHLIYLNDFVFQTCNFLMTKKDVNPDDVAAIYQAILDYSETDEFKELAANASYIPDLSDGETVKQTIADAAAMCQEAYNKYYAK